MLVAALDDDQFVAITRVEGLGDRLAAPVSELADQATVPRAHDRDGVPHLDVARLLFRVVDDLVRRHGDHPQVLFRRDVAGPVVIFLQREPHDDRDALPLLLLVFLLRRRGFLFLRQRRAVRYERAVVLVVYRQAVLVVLVPLRVPLEFFLVQSSIGLGRFPHVPERGCCCFFGLGESVVAGRSPARPCWEARLRGARSTLHWPAATTGWAQRARVAPLEPLRGTRGRPGRRKESVDALEESAKKTYIYICRWVFLSQLGCIGFDAA